MVRQFNKKFDLETLEDRLTPSTVTQNAITGQVFIQDNTPGQRALVSVTPGAVAGQINVNVDGTGYVFNGVPTGTLANPGLYILTGDQNDYIYNGTTITSFAHLTGGAGNSAFFSKGAARVTADGNGDTLWDTAGKSQLTVNGYGSAVFGGTGDTNNLNGDRDIIYDIVGPSQINLATHTKDYVFDNFASTTYGVKSTDVLAPFFAPGRAPGQFFLGVVGNTLFATADNAGDTLVVQNGVATLTSPTNGTITVNYGPNVNTVGAFGGTGTDSFQVLDPNLNVAMYGQGGAGNNLYAAGGEVNILKTGATASTSTANGSFYDLSTGAAPGQAGDTLNFNNANAKHVVLSQNPADVIFGRIDQQLGLPALT